MPQVNEHFEFSDISETQALATFLITGGVKFEYDPKGQTFQKEAPFYVDGEDWLCVGDCIYSDGMIIRNGRAINEPSQSLGEQRDRASA